MTTEELLRPRIKMIAPVPEYGMEVDTIIEMYGDLMFELSPTYKLNLTGVKRFPHIYKELHWWEERKPEDMPEYVKSHDQIFKVKEWADGGSFYVYVEKRHTGFVKGCTETVVFYPAPATEEEYTNQATPNNTGGGETTNSLP